MTQPAAPAGQARGWRRRLIGWSDALDRFTIHFYGPAEVGRADEPPQRTPAVSTCHLCGRPMAEHELHRVGGAGRMYCPPSAS